MLSGGGSVPPVPLMAELIYGSFRIHLKVTQSGPQSISDVHPEAGVSPSPGRRINECVNGFPGLFLYCFRSGLVTYDPTTSRLAQPPARLVTRPHRPRVSL